MGPRSLQSFVQQELAACLIDFDPVVAARAAAILTAWRGAEVRPQPRPLPHEPMPSLERLAALDGAIATVTMAEGGVWRMRLFAHEAPANVARFARMAASGAFNGRTFHRDMAGPEIRGRRDRAGDQARTLAVVECLHLRPGELGEAFGHGELARGHRGIDAPLPEGRVEIGSEDVLQTEHGERSRPHPH